MFDKMKRLLDRITLKELNGASTDKETLGLLECIDEIIDDEEEYVPEIPKVLENVVLSDIPLIACKQCIEPLRKVFGVFKDNCEVYLTSGSSSDFQIFYDSFEELQKMLHFFSDKLMEYGDWVPSYVIPGFENIFSEPEDVVCREYIEYNLERTTFAIERTVKALDECDKSTCMALFPIYDTFSVNYTTYLNRAMDKIKKPIP